MQENKAVELCGVIPPRQDDIVGYGAPDGFLAECIMPNNHDCNEAHPHVCRNPEGGLIAWYSEDDCGCCDITDCDRCVTYYEISEERFSEMYERAIKV